jgi:hypothetical protein
VVPPSPEYWTRTVSEVSVISNAHQKTSLKAG